MNKVMKKNSKPGRVRLNCDLCGKEFSTHSSDRTTCYKCKPKCYEIHYFDDFSKKRLEQRQKEKELEAIKEASKPTVPQTIAEQK